MISSLIHRVTVGPPGDTCDLGSKVMDVASKLVPNVILGRRSRDLHQSGEGLLHLFSLDEPRGGLFLPCLIEGTRARALIDELITWLI